MVKIEKKDNQFIFEVQGLHKLWAFRSQLTIPVENVIHAYPNEKSLNWINGLRMPGTHIPGLITAGTYYVKDGTIFCDVANPQKSIVVELQDESYKRLIIEVDDPQAAIDLLTAK